jgi:hypothetical protein
MVALESPDADICSTDDMVLELLPVRAELPVCEPGIVRPVPLGALALPPDWFDLRLPSPVMAAESTAPPGM